MKLGDLDQILALENKHQLHPWPRVAFEQALRVKQHCKVFVEDNKITAYGVSNGGHGRTICATNMPAAEAIYRSWFADAASKGINELWAQIEPENRAARVRLQRFRFECIGRVPSFYGPGIDAEVWRKRTQEVMAEQANEST